jgi:hypothetical protein
VSSYKPKSTRKRHVLQTTPSLPLPIVDKLSNLKKRNYIIGDSEDIVHMDWSGEWSELKNLGPLPDGHGSEGTIAEIKKSDT